MGSYWSQLQEAEKENEKLKKELHIKNQREEDKKEIDKKN